MAEIPREVLKLGRHCCGCGQPHNWWKVVKLHLQRASLPLGTLPEITNEYAWFAQYALDDYELLEHGVCVEWSWLTDAGKVVLEWLEKTDDPVQVIEDSYLQ